MSFKPTPTKTKLETVARALQLIQKTNSWTKHADLEQSKDSQGKTRSRFCLRGALRAAVTGDTAMADEVLEGREAKLINGSSVEITRTINRNPERYGLDSDDHEDGVVSFNDDSRVEHKHVVRALRDTVERLSGGRVAGGYDGSPAGNGYSLCGD